MVSLVYKDFISILNNIDGETDNIYINLVSGIIDYFQNNNEFPFISDYQ